MVNSLLLMMQEIYRTYNFLFKSSSFYTFTSFISSLPFSFIFQGVDMNNLFPFFPLDVSAR